MADSNGIHCLCFSVLGFSKKATRLIMSYIDIVQSSLLLNGSLIKQFKSTRGICQGERISPYVFILYVKVLSKMLLKEEELGNL